MNRHQFLLPVLVALTVVACSSTPIDDHYYSLVLAADDVTGQLDSEKGGAMLVIAPVTLSPFLDSYSLVIQTGSTEVQSANHHFWAEPLDRAIAKVLELDLNQLNEELSVGRQANSWIRESDCELRIEFDKFHATANSTVIAGGSYWLEGGANHGDYAFEFSRSLSVDGYAHAVDEMRNLLLDVADLISQSINEGSYCNVMEETG